MKTMGASPIANQADFLNGESAVLPAFYELKPAKMSLMESHGGYVVEDEAGRIYCISLSAVHRLGWNELGLPESDAYKTHISNRSLKNSKQEIN